MSFTPRSNLMVNGFSSIAVSMPGGHLIPLSVGVRTQWAVGHGRVMAGIGYRMNPGAGPHTTTDVGTMMTSMVGSGCQGMNGLLHGLSGGMGARMLDGHRWDRTHYSVSTSGYTTGIDG